MKSCLVFAVLIGLAACASTPEAGEEASSGDAATGQSPAPVGGPSQEEVTDAVLSPLEDFNLRREEIPEKLVPLTSPYSAPDAMLTTCSEIAREVAELTRVLGPDDDLPADDEERDTMQWASEESSEAALDAVSSQARGFIPFRGLVRDATGASAHSRRLARAYILGEERRAYLKGYGQAIGCTWPAAPLPSFGLAEEKIQFRGDTPE